MNILRASVVVSILAAACGGNDKKSADAGPPVPDARSCTSVTIGTVDFGTYDAATPFMDFNAPVPAGLGDGNMLQFRIELYGGIESSLAGTFDLTAGKQSNYATCAICVRAFDVDSMGNIVKQFFQSGGSVTLTEDPFTNKHMIGSITDLQLEEVMVDGMTFMSTPVAGGTCTSYGSVTLDHDAVPNAWTCTHPKFSDGATCDCMCGVSDPDCDLAAPTVAGCSAAQTCFADMCVTPPANDTCATAAPIVVGTPVTGTTIGAAKNYNAGLEGATCTNAAQKGPDVVYSVAMTQGTQYTVTLSNLQATYDGSVALVGPGLATICDANPITACVKGADAGFEGDNETFTYTPATTGTYYLIVDSFYTAEAGTFTLSVTSP